MKKRYSIFLTEEQERKFKRKAEELGFSKKSDYIRFMLLMEHSFVEKIHEIHKKVCEDNARKS